MFPDYQRYFEMITPCFYYHVKVIKLPKFKIIVLPTFFFITAHGGLE